VGAKALVINNDDSEREGMMKGKGVNQHLPQMSPLQLFSDGCAYGRNGEKNGTKEEMTRRVRK